MTNICHLGPRRSRRQLHVPSQRRSSRRTLLLCATSVLCLVFACSTMAPVDPEDPGDPGDPGDPSGEVVLDTIFRDDFESGGLSDPGRWQDIFGNGWSMVTAAAEGVPAARGARMLRVQPTGGAITHFVATGATSPYEHLRFSYWMYRRAGYASGGLRAGSIKGSRDQWGSFGNAGSCPDAPTHAAAQEYFGVALMQPESRGWKLRMYNYWLEQQKTQVSPPLCYGSDGLGVNDRPQALYHEPDFAPLENRWYHYEIELQLNTPGVADGWEKVWVDGVLTIEHTNVKYRVDPLTRIWVIRFDVGSTTVGTAYIDDVVVAVPRSP